MLETEYSGCGVKTMPAAALAPKAARASSGKVMAVWEGQYCIVVPELISCKWVKPNPRYNSEYKYIFYDL